MARQPGTNRQDALFRLATLIDEALIGGQRASGRRPEMRWSNVKFADAVGGAEAAVRTWRNRDKPARPFSIDRILKALYGDNPRFAEAKALMLQTWQQAAPNDREEPPPPEPITITAESFSDTASVVDLTVHRPTVDNYLGNVRIPYTLRITPDLNCAVGSDVKLKLDIGLSEPWLRVRSDHWQLAQDTVFTNKPHAKVRPHGPAGAVKILQPADNKGRIDGLPLADEPEVTMEPVGPSAGGTVIFEVLARQETFKITPPGQAQVSDAAESVIAAIFASGLPMDEKTRMLVLESRTVTPVAGGTDDGTDD